METKTGFRPDAKARKLLTNWQTCAYIHSDGILLWEKRTAKAGKYSETVNVWHVYKCQIRIDSNKPEFRQSNGNCGRIVVYRANALADGLASVSIYRDNTSEKMREMGLTADSIRIYTPAGAQHAEEIFPFLSSNYTIQPAGGSLEAMISQLQADGENIEEHC